MLHSSRPTIRPKITCACQHSLFLRRYCMQPVSSAVHHRDMLDVTRKDHNQFLNTCYILLSSEYIYGLQNRLPEEADLLRVVVICPTARENQASLRQNPP